MKEMGKCKDCEFFEPDELLIPKGYGRCLRINTDMPENKMKELIYVYTSDPFVAVNIIVCEFFGCIAHKKINKSGK